MTTAAAPPTRALSGLVLGLIGGIIAIRVRGVYFALITFGLAQVVAKVVYNTRSLGASDGLLGVPIIDIDLGIASVSSASPAGFILVVLAVIIALYAVSAYILDTPFGRLLIALRANDRRVTIEEIQKRVAEHFNIKISDMHSARRARAVARPRQVAMYLAKQLTSRSLPEIGRKFGGRDHTTVMHANRKIRELMAERRSIYNQVTELTNRIKQQNRG